MLNNLTIFFITSIAYCCLCIHRFPIIEPDPGHTKLRLSSEGLEAIKRITNPIAAVSVCPAFFLSPKLLCFSIILQSVTVMQWFLLFRMNFLCFKYSKCSLSMAAIVQSLLLIVHLQVDIFLICIAISRKISLFFLYIYIYPIFTVSFMVVQSGNRSISLWKIFSAQSASFPFLLRRYCFNLN